MKGKRGVKDDQAGERLFKALRELEIQFLNGGHSVQTGMKALLTDHDCAYTHQMAKYLVEQSIVKKDPDKGNKNKPFYYYNGPRLSVKYCNDLYLQMKLDNKATEGMKAPKVDENIKRIEELKHSIDMRLIEIDNLKGQFDSLRKVSDKWRAEAGKEKVENDKLKKKIKKIKKLLKAVL